MMRPGNDKLFIYKSLVVFVLFSPILVVCSTCRKPGSVISRFAAKGVVENIPEPVRTMPDTWIAAECPLSHQRRRYLLTDVFRDRYIKSQPKLK